MFLFEFTVLCVEYMKVEKNSTERFNGTVKTAQCEIKVIAIYFNFQEMFFSSTESILSTTGHKTGQTFTCYVVA